MRWPPPPPGRVRWAWLLEIGWRQRRVRRLLEVLDGRTSPGGVLLDVGGGTGVGTRIAVARAPPGTYRRSLVGDAQRGMLRRAGANAGRVDLAVGDAARLPVASESADVVLSLGVLCCLAPEWVPVAVDECWRVLRPGGLAVVAVPFWRGNGDRRVFLARGFCERAHPRTGWMVFQRPPSARADGTAVTPRA